jgi:plastocyanin
MADLIRITTRSAAAGRDLARALSIAGMTAHVGPGDGGAQVEIDEAREPTADLVRDVQRVVRVWGGDDEEAVRVRVVGRASAAGRSARVRRRRHLALLSTVPVVVGLGLAGCGGSSDGQASTTPVSTPPQAAVTTTAGSDTAAAGSGTTLVLAADPTGKLEFDKTELEAPAGKVTIVFTNDSPVEHNVVIEGNGVDVESELVKDGEQTTITADLEPGTYTYFCEVPGHEEAGMKGTLTVT